MSNKRLAFASLPVCCIALVTACTSVNPKEDFDRARQAVMESTGAGDVFDPDRPPITAEQINQVLADGLTLDEAVTVALTNNRRLQAAFMDIGVARADWVQSGLLRNPTLGLAVLLPEGGGRSYIEASIAQNLVDLWQIPTRRKIAKANLDAAVLRIARLAGGLAAQTRRSYYEAVAAGELLRIAEENRDLLGTSSEAIGQKRQAGAASLLDESMARGQLLAGEVAARAARLEADNAKRRLARLMSLEAEMTGVLLTDPLPAIGAPDLDPTQLIAAARTRRLDLMAYEAAMRAAGIEVALERSRAFRNVEGGARYERESKRAGEGDTIDYKVGPMLSLDVPIFDQNQAQVARRKHLHVQSMKSYQAAYIDVAQDIRSTIDAARTAAESLGLYRDQLLPQSQSNLDLAGEAYNAGQVTVLGLVESQRRLLDAQQGLITAHRDAAIALSDLELVTGSRIGKSSAADANEDR